MDNTTQQKHQHLINRLADREYTAYTTATAQTAYVVKFKIKQSDLDEEYNGDFAAWLSDCEYNEWEPADWQIDGKDGPLEYGNSISVEDDQGRDVCVYYDNHIDQRFGDLKD